MIWRDAPKVQVSPRYPATRLRNRIGLRIAKSKRAATIQIPHARLTILPAPTGHMVFTGRCLEAGRTALPRACNDPPGVDRTAVEAKTAGLAQAFFAVTAR